MVSRDKDMKSRERQNDVEFSTTESMKDFKDLKVEIVLERYRHFIFLNKKKLMEETFCLVCNSGWVRKFVPIMNVSTK